MPSNAAQLSGARIGLLTAAASRAGGGVFEAVVAQADMLRALGAVPVVIALNDAHAGADRARLGDAEVILANIAGPRQIGYAPDLIGRLRVAHLDLLHLHGVWMYPSGAGLAWARQTDKPYVVSPHLLDPWITGRGRLKKALARAGYERASWAAAAVLHAQSAKTGGLLAPCSDHATHYSRPNAAIDGIQVMPAQLFTTRRFGDGRGWFAETYNAQRLAAAGIDDVFVQDNQSFSQQVLTLRGIHFQAAPHAQAKLVRCLRGRIFDVVVDLRRHSPTFGDWTGAELTAEAGEQLYVPCGFGHGLLTLEPDTEVAYKVDSYYAPESEGGILWNDPALAIAWPLAGRTPVLSEKDSVLPGVELAQFDFPYDGRPLMPLVAQAL